MLASKNFQPHGPHVSEGDPETEKHQKIKEIKANPKMLYSVSFPQSVSLINPSEIGQWNDSALWQFNFQTIVFTFHTH